MPDMFDCGGHFLWKRLDIFFDLLPLILSQNIASYQGYSVILEITVYMKVLTAVWN